MNLALTAHPKPSRSIADIALLVILIIAVQLGCWWFLVNIEGSSIPEVQPLSQAIFLPLDEQSQGIDLHSVSDSSLHWQNAYPVDVPHFFSESEPAIYNGIYRFKVSIENESAPVWAIYVPRVNTNAQVRINKQLIMQTGNITSPISAYRHRPLIFYVDSKQLRKGENIIDVHVAAQERGDGVLGPIYFAAEEQLTPYWVKNHTVRASMVETMLTTLFCFALFFAILQFLLGKGDTVFIWYAVFILGFFMHTITFIWIDFPHSHFIRKTTLYFGATLSTAVLPVFLHRLMGVKKQRQESIIAVFAVCAFVLITALLAYDIEMGIWVGDLFGLIYLSFVFCFITLSVLRFGELSSFFFKLAVSLVLMSIALLLHDLLRYLDIIKTMSLRATVGVIPMTLMFFSVLLNRLIMSYRQVRSANQILTQKLAAKEKELSESYQQMRVHEKAADLSHERQRIMRDMHDGFGSQLLSIMLRAKKKDEELGRELQQSLDDLRLLIDSLDNMGNDLANALGVFRQRVEPRLNAVGVSVQWNINIEHNGYGFEPEDILNIYRILQEVCTNVIKHANCNELNISADVTGQTLYLRIKDNGDGFDAVLNNPGRGLSNIKKRASQLRGRAEITSKVGSGASVIIEISLPKKDPTEDILTLVNTQQFPEPS